MSHGSGRALLFQRMQQKQQCTHMPASGQRLPAGQRVQNLHNWLFGQQQIPPNLALTPSHRTDLAETAASALLPRALEPGIYSATFIFSPPKIFYP